MSDLLGRRRLFLSASALFAAASLAGGFAGSSEALIAVRAIQGIGAALLSPAALALLTVTFPAGHERNVALGIWGALAGIGGTLGVVAGGVLVDSLGWEWIFFVNVPVAAVALIATPIFVTESRRAGSGGFDFAGAVLGTAGLLALVGAVIRTDAAGWGSAEVLGLFGAAVILLGAFVAVEARAADPLVPLGLFRVRGLSVSGDRARAQRRRRSSACSSSPRCTCSRCTATARSRRARTSCRWASPRSSPRSPARSS